MLDDGEYSPWVKTIFASIKQATFVRGIRIYNSVTYFLISEFIGKSKYARDKQAEHFGYSAERVDRRLKRTPDRPDLWSRIMEKNTGPEQLTVPEQHSIASLFMVAGTETTATALSGTTYYLLKNPQMMDELKKEIRSAFATFDDLHLENLARQKYLMAVLQEGLRMYPPVPITLPRRTPKEGVTLSTGQHVPGDVTIGVHHYATYHDPKHFKYPDQFRPERWLGDEEFKDDHLNALEPFSIGPRNCLGKSKSWC
jgi:cytochrome P450